MNTLSKESIRVKNKNKGKRKKNKKVYSRNSVEKSSYEHIDLSSNNTNESFLSESSDTLNDNLDFHVNENLPGKIINSYKFKENSEIIVFEFRVSNKKWLLLGNYKPPSQNDLSFINKLNLALNFFSPIYENFVLLGDFNLSTENPNLKNFMCSFDLESLINSPTCYKSTNPSCIDLILTNKQNHFMKSATFETGLSDHHKLITTILRKTISKGNSKKMFYRDYKRFDQKKFETELKFKLNSQTNLSYSTFQEVFLEILNKIAPVKVKVLRFNNNAFMTKSLRKAIMLRSRLKNNLNKQRSDENWNNYKKQRNFCVKLLCQTKEKIFSDINVKSISDNKKFWKTIKPFFSNKGLNTNIMMLVEDNRIVHNEEIIANIMNNYFTNITTHLKLKPSKIDPKANLESIIDTFQNHESVQRIKLANVKKEILNLSSKKATRKGDIPAKILKNSINTYLSELTILINNCLKEGVFPDDLKLADITPIFKKEGSLNKENYRPISILSHLSKVFERILYKQIDSFMKNKFSPYLCGFRKNHTAQYSLLKMIKNWKKRLDNGEKVGAIFMDLSKAFDTINHSLLLAKLKAYGFSNQALRSLQSYLCNRFQRSIINGSFSSWNEMITGVPQGSILGPLLFNIFLNDIFLFISKCQLCNYADDNTLYKSGKNMQKIKNDLEMVS